MPTIEKRGKHSFRARVSVMEHGKQKQLTKTFTTKSEAKNLGAPTRSPQRKRKEHRST